MPIPEFTNPRQPMVGGFIYVANRQIPADSRALGNILKRVVAGFDRNGYWLTDAVGVRAYYPHNTHAMHQQREIVADYLVGVAQAKIEQHQLEITEAFVQIDALERSIHDEDYQEPEETPVRDPEPVPLPAPWPEFQTPDTGLDVDHIIISTEELLNQ